MARTVALSPFSKRAETEQALLQGLPVVCRLVSSEGERMIHHEIRHAVFVEEQGFFEGTDRDPHDDEASTLHVLALCGQVAAGAVRLYPLDEAGLWKGDRLAVPRAFRKRGVGVPLVRFAVRTAAERGGERMIAHVQVSNVPFFQRLGWGRIGGPVEYVGRPHQMMGIDLAQFRASP